MPRGSGGRSLRARIDRLGVRMTGTGAVMPSQSSLTARTAPGMAEVAPSTSSDIGAVSRLSEREFQRMLAAGLEQRGYVVWHVTDSRLMAAGLPDILAYHPSRPGVLLAWELKRERKYTVSPEQQAAIDHLTTIDGIDARIVRPSDWVKLKEEV